MGSLTPSPLQPASVVYTGCPYLTLCLLEIEGRRKEGDLIQCQTFIIIGGRNFNEPKQELWDKLISWGPGGHGWITMGGCAFTTIFTLLPSSQWGKKVTKEM